MRIILILLLSFIPYAISAQEQKSDSTATQHHKGIERSFTITAGIAQIKEPSNIGLVFTGAAIGTKIDIYQNINSLSWHYAPALSLGIAFSHNMPGYAIDFAPLQGFCDFSLIHSDRHLFLIGLGSSLTYHWQMYPSLHNSHLFAEAEIPVNLRLTYDLNVPIGTFHLHIANSIFGFSSHIANNSPYYYSLSFADFVVTPLKQLHFGSFGKYNHTNLNINWTHRKASAHRFGITIDYLQITSQKTFRHLSYALSWQKNF